jgi:N-acyl-D-glutamate deacylase
VVRTATRAVRAAWIVVSALVAASVTQAQSAGGARSAEQSAFDLVVANGRVIDPESGLDGIRSIGIRDGRIQTISRTPLRGREMLDATGLVVAPRGRSRASCATTCASAEK